MRQVGCLRNIAARLSTLWRRNESNAKIRSRQGIASRFRVEQLEPRILLSAELTLQPEMGSTVEPAPIAATVLVLDPPNDSAESQTAEEAADAAQYAPNFVEFTIETADAETTAAEDTSRETEPTSFNAGSVAASAANENLNSAAAENSASITEQLIETLRVANGPPIDSEPDFNSQTAPYDQIIYLDFDGATGVTYDGPVRVDDVAVYPFRAPAELAGEEAAIIQSLLTLLNDGVAGLGVIFTATRPDEATEYSTIYIGGDGASFSQYGSFLGLSEKVDEGNLDRSDSAFVFSDLIDGTDTSVEAYSRNLAGYVGHEAGHLLGFEHARAVRTGGKEDLLAEVAFNPFTHVEVAKDVRGDILDDGRVTIAGHEYIVHPKIVEAIERYPAYYYLLESCAER
jgi:hypothetical protein